MFGLIFLLLIVVPIVELYVLFQVADSFGWGISLLSLLAISLLGGSLMRWQTSGAWARVTDKIRQGEMPSKELVDGALMIFGGALLLTPGFFTDAVGLSMFIPPLRAIARRLVLRRVNGRVTAFAGTAGAAGPGFGFTTFSTGGPFGPAGTSRSRSDAIDVEEVIVERIDDPPSSLPPTTPPE
ncbi:MAG: FxsA family protein [Actinomycetota bacterium]